MTEIFATWAGDAPLGPYADDAPLTEVARPRNVQLFPSRYALLLVHRRGSVSARQAF